MRMSREGRGSFPIALLFSAVVELTLGLTVIPESLIIKPGEGAVVTCSGFNDTEVTWTSRKGKLSETTKPRVESGPDRVAIFFDKVTEADKGTYVCKAGNGEKNFTLTVMDDLVFVDTKSVQEGEEGTNVPLRCEVKGSGSPMMSWYSGGKELKKPKYEIIADGLLIYNVTKDDSKTYICRATQRSTGNISQKEVKLRVLHKPYPDPYRVLAEVEPAWGYIGSRVNLSCGAVAEPPPKFEWFIGNRNIKKNKKIYTETYKSVLELDIVNSSIFGNYKCKVSNKYGTLERIFALQKGERPQPPDFIELKGANVDLLDLGIHPARESTKGMEPTGYHVQYRLAGTDDSKEWSSQSFNITEEGNWFKKRLSNLDCRYLADSYPLRNLQSGSTYEIKVATRNVAGLSSYKNSSFFTTLHLEPDGAGVHLALLHYYFSSTVILLAMLTSWRFH